MYYYPFTSTQWKELEQQALIFKYLACGLPVPSDLIMQIKRSFSLDISIGPSRTFAFLSPQNPTNYSLSPEGSFGLVQTGFGRKRIEDSEPGRCRRTDGKKWRCSKDTFQDSKYCERHMHRGKNRSRKLVELSLATKMNNAYHPNSSSLSPYSPCKSNGSIGGLSLADDNHKGCYAYDYEVKKELFHEEQFEDKGDGFWFRSENKQNQFVLGSDFNKTEAEKPRVFHCFFD